MKRWKVLASQCTFHSHSRLRKAVEKARDVLVALSTMDSFPIDDHAYMQLMKDLARHGQWQLCDDLLSQLIHRNRTISLAHFHASMSAHARAGHVEKTKSLYFQSLNDFGFTPHSLQLALLAHIRSKPQPQMVEAEEFLDQAIEEHHHLREVINSPQQSRVYDQYQTYQNTIPTGTMYATLLEGYGQFPTAMAERSIMSVLERMRRRKLRLDHKAMMTLCEAFLNTQNLEQAEQLILSLEQHGSPLPHRFLRQLLAYYLQQNDFDSFDSVLRKISPNAVQDKFDVAVIAYRLNLRRALCTVSSNVLTLSMDTLTKILMRKDIPGIEHTTRKVALIRACAEENRHEEADVLYGHWFHDAGIKHNGVITSLIDMWLRPILWSRKNMCTELHVQLPEESSSATNQPQSPNLSPSSIPLFRPPQHLRREDTARLHYAGSSSQCYDLVSFGVDDSWVAQLSSQWLCNHTTDSPWLYEDIDLSVLTNGTNIQEHVTRAEALSLDLDKTKLTSYHTRSLMQWYMQIGDTDHLQEQLQHLTHHTKTPVLSSTFILAIKGHVISSRSEASHVSNAVQYMHHYGHPVFHEIRAFVDTFASIRCNLLSHQ
eukprot:gene10094-2262_t